MNLFDDIKPTLERVQINYGEQVVKSAFSQVVLLSKHHCLGVVLLDWKKISTVSHSEPDSLKSSCVDNLASDFSFSAPQYFLM